MRLLGGGLSGEERQVGEFLRRDGVGVGEDRDALMDRIYD